MPRNTKYSLIKSEDELQSFCQQAKNSSFIGFDTEFVSENRYTPELCLLQIATDSAYAIIDTLEVRELGDFWELLVEGDHVTVVHAAREEFLFCYRACGKYPKRLFDVQLAAAFTGLEYPCSYGNLVSRITGKTIDKGETRTDWKRRPLSQRQLDYALQDVIYLRILYRKLTSQLDELHRTGWYEEEMAHWIEGQLKMENEPQWRRVSGVASLNRESLAIARELWLWRDGVAEDRNKSPRRILPDDLLIELSKRGSADMKRLKAIRGLQQRVGVKRLEPVAEAIQTALDLPKSEYPSRIPRAREANLGLLGQFVTTALKIVCHEARVAPSLVGTSQDVRMLAAWKLGMVKMEQPPRLSAGWRAEIVGHVIEEILDGKLAIRVGNPKADDPLMIEEWTP